MEELYLLMVVDEMKTGKGLNSAVPCRTLSDGFRAGSDFLFWISFVARGFFGADLRRHRLGCVQLIFRLPFANLWRLFEFLHVHIILLRRLYC